MREELRAATGLHGKRLDALVDELDAKIADIARVAEMRLLDHPAEAAQQYAEMADALGCLIATQERVHPEVRQGVGLPTGVLIQRLRVAEDMAKACRKHVTKGRPASKGFYQRGLARAAYRIVLNHCWEIGKQNLRRAVAAVLKNAGHDSPNPKKDAAKFDQLSRPLPETIDKAAERDAGELAEELEKRSRGVPI